MGTGVASKPRRKDSFSSERSFVPTPPPPPPAAAATTTAATAPPRSFSSKTTVQPTTVKTIETSRKIVDLIDSDEDSTRELDSDIKELESTFTTMEMTSSSSSSSTTAKKNNDFYEFARKRPKRTGDPFYGRNSSHSSSFKSNSFHKKSQSVSSPVVQDGNLKFSWNDKPGTRRDKDRDEWTYKKAPIDGFDLAKYKKVNSKNEDKSTVNLPSPFENPMPGVPTYDRIEQQILASLEREINGIPL